MIASLLSIFIHCSSGERELDKRSNRGGGEGNNVKSENDGQLFTFPFIHQINQFIYFLQIKLVSINAFLLNSPLFRFVLTSCARSISFFPSFFYPSPYVFLFFFLSRRGLILYMHSQHSHILGFSLAAFAIVQSSMSSYSDSYVYISTSPTQMLHFVYAFKSSNQLDVLYKVFIIFVS